MKRFKIRNPSTGLEFSVEGETWADVFNAEAGKSWGDNPEIIETDLAPELAARETKRLERQAKIANLRTLKKKGQLTAADVIQAMPKILELLLGDEETDLTEVAVRNQLER